LLALEFTAPPVVPDTAVDPEAAPEFDWLDDRPALEALPVQPLPDGVNPAGQGGSAAGVDAAPVCAGVEDDGSVAGVCATAVPPRKARIAAMRAPTMADALEIFFAVPGIPVFIAIPCRCWSSTTLSGIPTPVGRSRSVFLAA
jgi:hypothetical protein